MENTNLTVLKEITPYLRCLQITNPKTYRGPCRALFTKICALLVLLIFVTGLCTLNLCMMWNGFNFQAVTIYLSSAQLIWSHISAITNCQQINQTFKHLSNVIAPRKLYICVNYTISCMKEVLTTAFLHPRRFYIL